MPANKNKSPTLLIKKALVAALPACILVYQKLINKYELKPTPYQPKNKTTKFAEDTKINIKKVNNERYDIKRVKCGSLYMYTHEYKCTQNDTVVTTINITVVNAS